MRGIHHAGIVVSEFIEVASWREDDKRAGGARYWASR